MPRSSSSSRSSMSTRPASPPKSLPLPAPVAHTPSPLVVQHQPNGFMANVKEGFGLGVGVSVARNLVDSFFTPRAAPIHSTPVTQSVKPVLDLKAYNQCILDGEMEDKCKDLIKELK